VTQRDYIAIANAVAQTRAFAGPDSQPALTLLTNLLADAMFADNPRFKRDKFMAACALEGANT
jgi:hypothetical protein